MSEDDRRIQNGGMLSVIKGDVRTAYTSRFDFDQQVVVADLGNRHIAQFGFTRAVAVLNNCFHGFASLKIVRGIPWLKALW